MFDGDDPVAEPLSNGPQPGRLWSLWNMLKVNSSAFYDATARLHRIEGAMLQFEHQFPDQGNSPVSKIMADMILENMAKAQEHAETMGAQVTAMDISEAIKRLQDAKFTNAEIRNRISTIGHSLRRELSLASMFVLERDKAKFFENAALFGAEVEKAFPAAAFEIEEAGKCLALSRPTAAVFHLMRAMEVGLRATAACLGIPDPIKDAERNWGVVLRKIRDELDARGKSGKSWSTPRDKQFFSEVYGSIDALRVAWRNSTMHVESKYTDDEAEHIWAAAKGFMRKLASRCDEEGNPNA